MRIGIFGRGTVGSAVENFYKEFFDVYAYDIKDGEIDVERLKERDVVFVCAPTPTKSDGPWIRQDTLSIESVLQNIVDTDIAPLVILKSTVLPGTTDLLAEEYGLTIVHNPEFLSEDTALEDFINQKFVYIGIPENVTFTDEQFEMVETLFSKLPYRVHTTYEDAKTIEMVKYTANCFYATKVAYFHSIYDMCEGEGIDYNKVRDMAAQSMGWILHSHTKAPGKHGLGYAGNSFPDNMKALALMNPFVEKVDEYNDELREKNNFNAVRREP